MIPLDDPMSLSLLFHLNSEPWLNDRAYSGGGGPQKRLTDEDVKAQKLEALRKRDPILSAAIDALDLEVID